MDTSDDKRDPQNPVHDSFYVSVRVHGIRKVANSTTVKITYMYSMLEPAVITLGHQSRGSRSAYSLFDVLFMVLTVYKNKGAWDAFSAELIIE